MKWTSDEIDAIAEDVEPLIRSGQRRPTRANPFRQHVKKKSQYEIRAGLEEAAAPGQPGSELGLGVALNATSEEQAYLREQLSPFFNARLITQVLQRVKGGKEANVYCCAAHPSTGREWLAAKVYRPRQFRNLKNDAQYRQGRVLLTADGQAVDLNRDWRLRKAIAGKSRKGLEATQASWVAYEYQTMQRLHAAGVQVPQPLQNSGHALLMQYFGTAVTAAPTLHLVSLEPAEAGRLFVRLLQDVELMLAAGVIHGDLSAYNILYWNQTTTLIDFPQMVDPYTNPDSRILFGRDLQRLCSYFCKYGVEADPAALAQDLWKRHIHL